MTSTECMEITGGERVLDTADVRVKILWDAIKGRNRIKSPDMDEVKVEMLKTGQEVVA